MENKQYHTIYICLYDEEDNLKYHHKFPYLISGEEYPKYLKQIGGDIKLKSAKARIYDMCRRADPLATERLSDFLETKPDNEPKIDNHKKGTANMFDFNSSKLTDRFFQKVTNVSVDLMTGLTGIAKKESIYTCEFDKEGDPTISENLIASLSMPIPAFAQRTILAEVKPGDILVRDSLAVGWVVSVSPKSLKTISVEGTQSNNTPPKVSTMGMDQGVMIVKNMFGNTGELQSNLLPLMMMGAGQSEVESFLPILLMQQGGMLGGQNSGMNTIQMLMMAKLMGK